MSTIKVNTVTKRTGSTLTLGESGTTVTLACGATQTGFGRTGTVDWCTTAKTSPFTSVSGKGYFVNTTSGAVTVTLPASPSAGDIVSVSDYAQTSGTNAITLCRNSSKIEGGCANKLLVTDGDSITLVYVDGTRGWKLVNTADQDSLTGVFISASGGTETTSGNYKIHTFTSDGTFTVNSVGGVSANNEVSYLVIAGGGHGGKAHGGGGGAGGYRESKSAVDCYSASPLEGSTPITVTATSFPITVGAGASAPNVPGPSGNWCKAQGSPSVFSTITSTGGGFGGQWSPLSPVPGDPGNGGSGGGVGGYNTCTPDSGGLGNTPPVSPPQGNNGGSRPSPSNGAGAGGGGAACAGASRSPDTVGGTGGAGTTTSINGTPTARAGGGGGGQGCGTGGTGGGGDGGGCSTAGIAGTANTGGGGGGGGSNYYSGGNGGSGTVIIRYKFQ